VHNPFINALPAQVTNVHPLINDTKKELFSIPDELDNLPEDDIDLDLLYDGDHRDM
jgi:hypothetical protein